MPSTFHQNSSCFGVLFFLLIPVRQTQSTQKLTFLAIIEETMHKVNSFPVVSDVHVQASGLYQSSQSTNYGCPQGLTGLAQKILLSIQNISQCLNVLDTIKNISKDQKLLSYYKIDLWHKSVVRVITFFVYRRNG